MTVIISSKTESMEINKLVQEKLSTPIPAIYDEIILPKIKSVDSSNKVTIKSSTTNHISKAHLSSLSISILRSTCKETYFTNKDRESMIVYLHSLSLSQFSRKSLLSMAKYIWPKESNLSLPLIKERLVI